MIKVQLMQTASSGSDLMKRNVPSLHTVPWHVHVCLCVCVCVCVLVTAWNAVWAG